MSLKFSTYWFVAAMYSLAQKFAITIFGLLSFLMLIRLISVELMSYWGIFLMVVSIFESIKTNLIKNAFIKYFVQAKTDADKREVSTSAFVLNIALSFLFSIVIIFFSGIIGEIFNCREILPGLLYWYLPGVVFQTFFSHLEFLKQAEYNFKKIFQGYFAKQLFFLAVLGILFFFYKGQIDLRYISVAQSLSIFIGFLILLYGNVDLHLSFSSISINKIKELISYGKYIFGSGLMATLFANVDQILTASVLSSKSIAYYSAASKINALVDIPSYAAAEIAFPRLAKADQYEGKLKVKYLYEKMVGVLMAITLPLSVFIILFPSFIIKMVAGSEYLDAVVILQIYMITSVLRPMQNQAANVLNSIGKEALCFYINLFSLIVNLIINYFFIREYGFYGAAYGTLITFLAGCIFWYFVMKKQIDVEVRSIFKSIAQTYKLMWSILLSLLFANKIKEFIIK